MESRPFMRCPLGNIRSQLPSSLFSSPHIVPKENKKVCLSNFSFECNNLPHICNDFPFPLTSPIPFFLPLPFNPPAQVCTARLSQSCQNGCECYLSTRWASHKGPCVALIPQGNTKNNTIMGSIRLTISYFLFKCLCKTEYIFIFK